MPEGVSLTPITWRTLRDEFGPEVVAHGHYLYGIVCYKDEDNWANSPNVRLCDPTGDDGVVFFYTALTPPLTLDEVCIGSTLQLRSPRLHTFADTQEGLRIDDASDVLSVGTSHLTLTRRLQFAQLSKEAAARWIGRCEWERAIPYYNHGIQLLSYCCHSELALVEKMRALRTSCYSNLCLCYLKLNMWPQAIEAGHSALEEKPSDDLRARACYRIALAHEATRDFKRALSYALRAKESDPWDGSVLQLCDRLQRAVSEDGAGVSALLRNRRKHVDGMNSRFGYQPPLLGLMSGKCVTSSYFVDCTHLCRSLLYREAAKIPRKHMLYVLGTPIHLCPAERHALSDTYGIKTYLYFSCAVSVTQSGVQCTADMLGATKITTRRTIGSDRHPHITFSCPPHMEKPTLICFHVAKQLLPCWLYFIVITAAMLGFPSWADSMAAMYIRKRLHDTTFLSRLNLEVQTVQGWMAHAEHYPVVITSDMEAMSVVFILLLTAALCSREGAVEQPQDVVSLLYPPQPDKSRLVALQDELLTVSRGCTYAHVLEKREMK